MLSRLLAKMEDAALATTRGASSFSAVKNHAPCEKYPQGFTEDLGVIAFDHPDRWRVFVWRWSRRLRGLPVGQIHPTREVPQ